MLSAEKPGFVTARYGARSNTIPRHATQSHRGNGDEGPGHQDDSSRRHRGKGSGSGRRPGRFRCKCKRCASPISVDGSNCNQPAAHRPMTWVSIVSSISRLGAITSARPTAAPVQNFTQERPGRAGDSTGRKYHHLLSEWSGCFQRRCGGCRGGRRNARHGHPLAPDEGLHRSRQSRRIASGVPPSAFLYAYPQGDSGNLPASLNGGGTSQLRPDGTFEFRSIVPGTYVLQLGASELGQR